MIASLYQSVTTRSTTLSASVLAIDGASAIVISVHSLRVPTQRFKAPDCVWLFVRIERHLLDFSSPSEVHAGGKILDPDRCRIGQPEFPQRHLEVRDLGVMWVEIYGDEQEVGKVGSGLAIIDDVVIPGVVESQIGEL